jgi:hypothetical protein
MRAGSVSVLRQTLPPKGPIYVGRQTRLIFIHPHRHELSDQLGAQRIRMAGLIEWAPAGEIPAC